MPEIRPVATELADVSAAAAAEHGTDVDLLDGYVPALLDVAATLRRLEAPEIERSRALGGRAVERGVSLPTMIDLYMTASRRLWPLLQRLVGVQRGRPLRALEWTTIGEAVWRAADDALTAVTDGYLHAQRLVVRGEEVARQEFIDDLLSGGSDVGSLIERGTPLGLTLTASHLVAVAQSDTALDGTQRLTGWVEESLRARFGDHGSLAAVKDGRLVCVVSTASPRARQAGPPGPGEAEGDPRDGAQDLADLTLRATADLAGANVCRVGVSRPHPGPNGVLRSYREALEALDLATRLELPDRIVHARHLLVYRVLLRDEAAVADLVHEVLGPLTATRGGPQTLLETLEAYFAVGCNAAEAARRLHLSVRALTYRLQRVEELIGYAPGDPEDRLPLHVAVVAARLLDWPHTPLRTE